MESPEKITQRLKSLEEQLGQYAFTVKVSEFVSALTKSYTYNITRNSYTIFGFLWGLSFPFLFREFILLLSHESLSGIQHTQIIYHGWKTSFVLLASSLFHAIVFGAMGTIRYMSNEKIFSVIRQLTDLAEKDPLTRIYNRNSFLSVFRNQINQCRRFHSNLCLFFIDIDYFKRINDQFGHAIGDEVIRTTAQLLIQSCRSYDTVARWGGEEFIMLLPQIALENAEKLGQRIRKTFENFNFHSEESKLHITISMGIAALLDEDSADTLIGRADAALLEAKKSGRNCVVVYKGAP
jgi:diguanylate cyclase (GGDEF)-like protein